MKSLATTCLIDSLPRFASAAATQDDSPELPTPLEQAMRSLG